MDILFIPLLILGTCFLKNGLPTVDIHEYPWLALVEYERRKALQVLCGGTLISSKYVLTAAHCVVGRLVTTAIPTNVRLGEYNQSNDGPDCIDSGATEKYCTDGETRIKIEKTIPHPQFEMKQVMKGNNIALIRMKDIAPYSDFIRPICLPTKDVTDIRAPIYLRLASWGTTYGPSDVKIYVDLPFVPQGKCQSQYSSLNQNITLGNGHLCAGGQKGYDACRGDSGMPLMYNNGQIYEVVGLLSFGYARCGSENVPSIYTNIFEYNSWIMNNISP